MTLSNPLPEVARLVDLDRYPIHDLASARTRDLIAGWRAEFDRTGACNLQGFVTPEGAVALAAEAIDLLPLAHRRAWTRNFLDEMEDDPSRPSDHPGHRFWTSFATQLADDQIGPETGIRQLYEWEALTEFVAQVQGKSKLYRFADEFQALNIIALGDGDRDIWHFDDNECTVTLLLQEPEAGGDFVYGRNTMDPDGNIDLEEVRRLIDAPLDDLERLERSAGTLTLFRGGHSLHGVTPVRGQPPAHHGNHDLRSGPRPGLQRPDQLCDLRSPGRANPERTQAPGSGRGNARMEVPSEPGNLP